MKIKKLWIYTAFIVILPPIFALACIAELLASILLFSSTKEYQTPIILLVSSIINCFLFYCSTFSCGLLIFRENQILHYQQVEKIEDE